MSPMPRPAGLLTLQDQKRLCCDHLCRRPPSIHLARDADHAAIEPYLTTIDSREVMTVSESIIDRARDFEQTLSGCHRTRRDVGCLRAPLVPVIVEKLDGASF